MDRPNIILMMTDQQRWDTVGYLGFEHMITPSLDKLAERGVAFNHAFVQGAVCGPSRNSIVSGQYVHTHGVERNEEWLLPEQPNWIERLQEGGYHTANIGKMHTAPIRLACGFDYRLVVENKNYRQGHHGPDPDDYDLFLAEKGLKRPALSYYQDVPDWPDKLGAITWPHDESLYPDNYVGDQTVNYIRDFEFDQPLFMWCGFSGPHDPYDVTESALRRYDNVEIPDPVGIANELDSKPPPQREAMLRMDGNSSPAAIWLSRATPERMKNMRKHYYANVTVIDDWVGRIVNMVEERGQLDNTLFVFTSDHGDCLGDHHQVYKFSSHYDSVARVPLICAGTGVKHKGVRDPLVELIDLGPTFLELAGLEPLEGASGKSLRSLLKGGDEEIHEAVYSEYGQRIMERTHEWKLVFYIGEAYGELYDLSTDPDELINLFGEPAYQTERQVLIERMMDWYSSTRMQRM